MWKLASIRRVVPAAFALSGVVALSGCAALNRSPEPVAEPAASAATRPPEPVKPPSSERPSSRQPSAGPVRAGPAPQPAPRNVRVLFEADTPEYAEVAARIAASLPPERYRVVLDDIGSAAGADNRDALAERDGWIAVAVGRDAVDAARERLPNTPIVFCQVFSYEDLLGRSGLWGIEPLPPLGLQLRAWKAVDPLLKRVGLIVSEEHADVVAAATAAAKSAGVEIVAETSSSDRETLYLFKRLAADVDGFWLFPDSRILSPGVLHELLGYAQTHEVGVLVLNKTLLSWGALLSATARPDDVAARVHGLLDRIATGRTQDLPPMSSLGAVELQLNPGVAARLGASNVSPEPWVLHEPD